MGRCFYPYIPEYFSFIRFEIIFYPCALSFHYFYPYGLIKSSGKIGKKKVGKFLRDVKVDALTRNNAYVILSGQHIVAVVGMRIDARFAVTDATKEVMIISKK